MKLKKALQNSLYFKATSLFLPALLLLTACAGSIRMEPPPGGAGTIIPAATTPGEGEQPMPVMSTTPAISPNRPGMPCIIRAAAAKPFDLTVPDGMLMQPGQSFEKTWRLVNEGTCAWTEDFRLVWFSGTPMTTREEQPLNQLVEPGEEVDVTILMTAPELPGEFQSNWKLADPEGNLFGIGPNGDAPFWARIRVSQAITATPRITPTATAIPLVFSEGSTMLVMNEGFDLDNGLQNPASGLDIQLWEMANGDMILKPANGAALSPVEGEPSPAFCKNLELSEAVLYLSTHFVNQSFCYVTDLGLPGVLRFVQVVAEEKYIEITYTTWVVP